MVAAAGSGQLHNPCYASLNRELNRELTNALETLFGRMAQRLRYKADALLAHSETCVLEYLAQLTLLPDALRGFSHLPPKMHKRHYDAEQMESFCSAGAGDAQQQRYI